VPVAVGEIRGREPDPERPGLGPVELLEIGARQVAPLGQEFPEVGQLAEPDPRGDVGHVEFPADPFDLHPVVAGPHHALEPVLLREPRLALVVHDEASSLAGRDVLVGVEAERHEVTECPNPPPLPGASEGLRRVLHHAQAAPPRDGVQPVAVDGEPGEIDREDRAGARRDGRPDAVEVDRAGGPVDVDEHGPGPGLEDHVA
jgi:hypothetical protein